MTLSLASSPPDLPFIESWRREVQRLTTKTQRMVSVHLTDFCNSKCTFCVVNSPIRQIPIETRKLVDHVLSKKGMGYEILNIHGGEPTISEALFPVLKAGAEIGVNEVHLQTNGITLSNKAYLHELIKAGVTLFVVSVHGHTAALQEGITLARNSFKKVIQGIRNAQEAGCLVRTNTVVCQSNIGQFYEILRFIAEMRVQWINISALHPTEHAASAFDELVVHPQLVRQVVPDAVRRLRVDFPDVCVQLEGFATCHAPSLEDCHLERERLRDIEVLYHDYVIKDYDSFMQTTQRTLLDECDGCISSDTCNGLYTEYVSNLSGELVWPILRR